MMQVQGFEMEMTQNFIHLALTEDFVYWVD